LDGADGSQEAAVAALDRPEGAGRAGLIDQCRNNPVCELELDRGETLDWGIEVIGGGGPGAEALIGTNPGAVDISRSIDRPVNIELVTPLRRATAGPRDRDGIDRRKNDLEMLAAHPGWSVILGGTHRAGCSDGHAHPRCTGGGASPQRGSATDGPNPPG
jgi:hypothetical protein